MSQRNRKPNTYILPPTKLIPNSDLPLLHYPAFFEPDELSAVNVAKVFAENGWEAQWLARYGTTQTAHYHSKTHEAMAVLHGTATIRFGVADLNPATAAKDNDDDDDEAHLGRSQSATATTDDDDNEDEAREAGGMEFATTVGDVWVIPAGVSHKSFNTKPEMPFQFLTGGGGHAITVDLAQIELSGFIMLGAYPKGASEWDFCVGGEEKADVATPAKDPVLGADSNGLSGVWG